MDRGMTLIGRKERLGVSVAWTGDSMATAADATRGTLDVWVAGARVWGRDGIEWTWIELLEHLSRFWSDLLLEEQDPLNLGVEPELLRNEAARRWSTASGDREEQEEEALFAYLEAHNLAAGLMGVFPPALFVTRQGKAIRVASQGRVARVPREEAEAIFVALGDAIAKRLETVSDERARLARSAWAAKGEDVVVKSEEV